MTGGQIFALMVVAMVMVASVFKARYRQQAHRVDPTLTAENDRLRAEIGILKDRVAVLERIATDKPDTLSREIEALRDS